MTTDPSNCGSCDRVCSATTLDLKNIAEMGCSARKCVTKTSQAGQATV
ncbi:MAG: hypothetical protein Q8R70_09480 [Methanoregula sp.]|nr:hypothetical protein [Methanoregula sp.]